MNSLTPPIARRIKIGRSHQPGKPPRNPVESAQVNAVKHTIRVLETINRDPSVEKELETVFMMRKGLRIDAPVIGKRQAPGRDDSQ
jgi:hypothetical protein